MMAALILTGGRSLLTENSMDHESREGVGCGRDRRREREVVTSVFRVTRRNTFHKQCRAAAYAFPLDEFDRGGRPADRNAGSSESEASGPA